MSYREPRDLSFAERDPYSSNPTSYPPPLHYPAHPQQPSYPQAYPGTHYPGGPRPSTADVADNFLLSWQRSVAGTSGIPVMPFFERSVFNSNISHYNLSLPSLSHYLFRA